MLINEIFNPIRTTIVPDIIKTTNRVAPVSGAKPLGRKEVPSHDLTMTRKALATLGNERWLFNYLGETVVVQEYDELLDILFSVVREDMIKYRFRDNPNTIRHIDCEKDKKKQWYSRFNTLYQESSLRLIRLCGSKVYRYTTGTREDLERLKILCISPVYTPLSEEKAPYTDEEVLLLHSFFKNLVSTLIASNSSYSSIKDTDLGLILNEILELTAKGIDFHRVLLDRLKNNEIKGRD